MAALPMTGARILEVGCGSGVGSLSYASVILGGGSVLVSCDFSKEMVKLLKERYDSSDYAKAQNKYEVDAESDFT